MNMTHLPAASWDLLGFLESATSYVQGAGGALLILMGTAGVVWGGVLLIKKLMASQQDQTSWVKIIALVLIGGALMVGGFNLIASIAAGGKTTIEDLGGASIFLGLDLLR